MRGAGASIPWAARCMHCSVGDLLLNWGQPGLTRDAAPTPISSSLFPGTWAATSSPPPPWARMTTCPSTSRWAGQLQAALEAAWKAAREAAREAASHAGPGRAARGGQGVGLKDGPLARPRSIVHSIHSCFPINHSRPQVACSDGKTPKADESQTPRVGPVLTDAEMEAKYR